MHFSRAYFNSLNKKAPKKTSESTYKPVLITLKYVHFRLRHFSALYIKILIQYMVRVLIMYKYRSVFEREC